MGGIAANGKIDSKREVVTHLIVQIHFSSKQITSSQLTFVNTLLYDWWHYNSYSILAEVFPIRAWSTGSSGDGMVYSMRSIDCVDWLHHITIR